MRMLFRKPVFVAVTLGHFILDVFNSAGPVLVTSLSTAMALSRAQYGFAVGAYQFFAALTQPLFGWIDDKVGSRWLGPGSVAWTIGFVVISLVVAQETNNFYWFIVPFVLASVGSSAFHPLGTKHAADTSLERAATGTAVFFLFGQAGLSLGPIAAGIMLDQVGMSGIYAMAAATLPIILLMSVSLRHTSPKLTPFVPDPALDVELELAKKEVAKKVVSWGAITVLALLLGFRSWSTIGTVTFLPKLFQEMGWDATGYGLITGTFWMASAIAGVIAGSLADRLGRRQIVFVTMFLGSIPLYFLPMNSDWLPAFLLVILSGGLLGASHSILVVIAQDVLPGGRSFSSGVTLGYVFGTGAIAAWIIGIMADIWSLGVMIQLGTLFGLVAAFLALMLPITHKTSQPQTEGVPA